MSFRSHFNRFANASARAAGSPWATILAVWLVVAWAVSGPFFHFGETWQLVINTGTTIITFLMVFVIQHSQNCDAAAVHIKLDEIIRVLSKADNALMDLTKLDEKELDELRGFYDKLARKAQAEGAGRVVDAAAGAP